MRILIYICICVFSLSLYSCGPGIVGEDENIGRYAGLILGKEGLLFYARMDEEFGRISDFRGRAIGTPMGDIEYSQPGGIQNTVGTNSSIGFNNDTDCFRFGEYQPLKLQYPFTIMAMVYLFTAGGTDSIIASDGFLNEDWNFVVSAGNLALEISTNGTAPTTHSGPVLGTFYWAHVAVTVDAAGTVTFYNDGGSSAAGPPTLSGQPHQGVGNSITIGCADGTLGLGGEQDFFDGQIDELAVFNRALSHQEILEIYNSRFN